MQVLAMKAFGVNVFAAWFPDAIVGIVTLITLYLIGEKHFSHRFGLLWILVYAGFEIAEITCPTKYTEESSSINFKRSVQYGLGVLKVSIFYFLQKAKLGKFKIFEGIEPGK